MLKRLLGILFTLAALATFVWVGMGRYTSWCFAGKEVTVEKVLPAPVNTVSADTAAPAGSADPDPADAAPADAAPADPGAAAADRADAASADAAPADSLSSPAADAVR